MSRRAWKAARRLAREVGAETARRAEAARHLPAWRSVALAFGIRGPAKRWGEVWQKRHERALAIAEKKTAHAVVGIAGTGTRREYRMRPGAPAAPKGGVA